MRLCEYSTSRCLSGTTLAVVIGETRFVGRTTPLSSRGGIGELRTPRNQSCPRGLLQRLVRRAFGTRHRPAASLLRLHPFEDEQELVVVENRSKHGRPHELLPRCLSAGNLLALGRPPTQREGVAVQFVDALGLALGGNRLALHPLVPAEQP